MGERVTTTAELSSPRASRGMDMPPLAATPSTSLTAEYRLSPMLTMVMASPRTCPTLVSLLTGLLLLLTLPLLLLLTLLLLLLMPLLFSPTLSMLPLLLLLMLPPSSPTLSMLPLSSLTPLLLLLMLPPSSPMLSTLLPSSPTLLLTPPSLARPTSEENVKDLK